MEGANTINKLLKRILVKEANMTPLNLVQPNLNIWPFLKREVFSKEANRIHKLQDRHKDNQTASTRTKQLTPEKNHSLRCLILTN